MYEQMVEGIRSYIASDGLMQVVAPDGQFLGWLTSDIAHPDAIANPMGVYGAVNSPTSINNPNSLYGGFNGVYSPYNPNCFNPPRLIVNGVDGGVLSANPNITEVRHNLDLITGILVGAGFGYDQQVVAHQMALEHQRHQFELAKKSMEMQAEMRRISMEAATRFTLY